MDKSTTNEIDKLTLKRLEGEVRDLGKNRMHFCQAIKSDSDPFIFYFLLRGDDESDYEGGYYLGKILLPQTYPEKPGDFMMLTPNGRFDIDKKICLTNSGYHTENWTPLWNIRIMIIGCIVSISMYNIIFNPEIIFASICSIKINITIIFVYNIYNI